MSEAPHPTFDPDPPGVSRGHLVCAEFGSGTVSAEALAVYEAGVRNALINRRRKVENVSFRKKRSSQALETLSV